MDRKTAVWLCVALAVGYWLASGQPAQAPQPARPVARFVAKVAKNLLWIALLAEQPPAEPQPNHHVARAARIGDDGYPIVDNARGW